MPGQHVMFQCQPKTARFSQKPGGEGVHRAEAEEGVTQLLPTGLNAKKKERGGGSTTIIKAGAKCFAECDTHSQ